MTSRNANLLLRAGIMKSIRGYFESQGFLEVETPLRIPANAPEEHIDPYRSEERYLQTSPELCMKRLLARGHGKIFQICRCWRSSERGSRHLPEFTMLEWYRANSDYRDLMRDCEGLLAWVARSCISGETVSYGGKEIKMTEGASRITVRDAFALFASEDLEDAIHDGGFDEIMATRIEPALAQERPVILLDYPAGMAALARLKPDDPSVAERFELYAGGLELANGFSELIDPVEQQARFIEANHGRIKAGLPPLPLPAPFLDELSAMPPSAGIALGIDRLVMLLGGAERIDEVVAFTPDEL